MLLQPLENGRMPCTEAFMLEVHRTAILMPNLVPRRSIADFKFEEFTIPKVFLSQN